MSEPSILLNPAVMEYLKSRLVPILLLMHISQEYVKLLLGLPEIPKPDHAADALAAAITYVHSNVTKVTL